MGKDEKNKGEKNMEVTISKKEQVADLSQVWKNSIKLNGKDGEIILDPNNHAHREWYKDEDDK